MPGDAASTIALVARSALSLGLFIASSAIGVTLLVLVVFAVTTGASIGGGSLLDVSVYALAWLRLLTTPVSVIVVWVTARRTGQRRLAFAAVGLLALWLASASLLAVPG